MNPKNQTNPNNFWSNNTDGNQNEPFQPKPKKTKTTRWIIGIVIFLVIAIPVAYISTFVVIVSNNGSEKMEILNNHAASLENELNNLLIVNGEAVKAKGAVSGDGFSANSDPKVSTYAQSTIQTNKTLAAIESEVSINLSKAGYIREGEPENPYYSTSEYPTDYNTIIFRYIKDENAIKIAYSLDKSYGCLKGYVCKFVPGETSKSPVYPASGFGTLPVTGLTITLGGKSYNYMTNY